MVDTHTPDYAAIIGAEDADADWILRPEKHCELIADKIKAGPLLRILSRDDLKNIIETYNREDQAAIHCQERTKKWGRISIYATLWAVLIGALFLLPWPEWSTDIWLLDMIAPGLKTTGLGLEILAIVVTFLAGWWVKHKQFYKHWQEHRAEAEHQRLKIFNAVMAADEQVRSGEEALLPLKLEYFRRFLLDEQMRYYSGRGNQHKEGSLRSLYWKIFSKTIYLTVAALAVVSFLSIVQAQGWFEMAWFARLQERIPWLLDLGRVAEQSLAGLGVITSAIYTASTALARLDMDEHNATRYLNTAGNLETLAGVALDNARQAARTGQTDDVLAFVEQVHSQISTEHQQWRLIGTVVGRG